MGKRKKRWWKKPPEEMIPEDLDEMMKGVLDSMDVIELDWGNPLGTTKVKVKKGNKKSRTKLNPV